MCGIAGIVAANSKRYSEPLQKMTDALAHRGPDGEGAHFFQHCALGHRRLSIIDVETGQQPMVTPSGNIGITLNGEIYGYQAIKQKELRDYPFQTTSDTEIVLALYERHAENFLSHLPGMFAFALWDDAKRTLICARDRFGEKPFYYAFGNKGEFIFASEIKAILASNLVVPTLRKQSLIHYLQKLYVDPRHTIYENIFTLPPAHRLFFNEGNLKVERYWHFPDLSPQISMTEAIPEFQKLFNNAVEKQLVADVPVGAFLSGGLDSSTIVAVASQFKKNLKTYSFAFRNSINELPYARSIAKKYNTDHMELFDDSESIADLLIKMQEIYDEPFADSSNIPTYMISKLASQHTKVILTGDGGDELLGGYGSYKTLYFMSQKTNQLLWNNQLSWLVSKAIAKLPFQQRHFLLHRHLGAAYAKKYTSAFEAHRYQAGIFNPKELYSFGFEDLTNHDYQPSWQMHHSLDDALRSDLETYMPGDILVKTDRAAMANGLELRAPFLDVDFASFCMKLPYVLKINKKTEKLILRKSFDQTWTHAIRQRTKQGFGAPVARWLQDKKIIELRHDYLGNKSRKIFQIMPYDAIQQVIKNNNYKTWSLLVLSLWLESHDLVY